MGRLTVEIFDENGIVLEKILIVNEDILTSASDIREMIERVYETTDDEPEENSEIALADEDAKTQELKAIDAKRI